MPDSRAEHLASRGLHLPPSARNGKALHLPPGADASPVDRAGPTEDELTELVAAVAEIDRTFTLELDAHSLLALFSAAHLALRHPALAGSATETAVVALTDHVAASIAADAEGDDGEPVLLPLARLLRLGLDPKADR